MNKTGTATLVVFLLVLLVVSLFAAGSANAQSIPKPLVPQFTVYEIHNTYDHPAVYAYDEYTGGQKLITPAKHDEITYVAIKIKNQPFTPFKDLSAEGNSSRIKLCYWVQTRGHFSTNDWSTTPPTDKAFLDQWADSEFTTMSYYYNNTEVGSQIDFRVAAVVGYEWGWYYNALLSGTSFKTLTSSDLSEVQTVTITHSNATQVGVQTTPHATVSPSVSAPVQTTPPTTSTPISDVPGSFPSLNWLEIAGLIVVGVVVTLLVVVVVFQSRRIGVLEQKQNGK